MRGNDSYKRLKSCRSQLNVIKSEMPFGLKTGKVHIIFRGTKTNLFEFFVIQVTAESVYNNLAFDSLQTFLKTFKCKPHLSKKLRNIKTCDITFAY